jgi:hypothetical protein
MVVDEEHIEMVAKDTLCWPENRKWEGKDLNKRFRAFFGAPSLTIADVWNRIWERLGPDEKDQVCKKGTPQCQYLLYALLFLKLYASEEVHCSIVGWPSVKTFRKWSWYFIEKMSDLKDDIIILDRRFENLPEVVTQNCFISVDGTDCPVFEPWPFDSKMYSFKTQCAALRYEVGVAISTGFIVWVSGPHKAGRNDWQIFNADLTHRLCDDECVEVDQGYKGNEKFKTPEMGADSKGRKEKSLVRARHENINGKLKTFNLLTTHFRHMKPNNKFMEKHGMCFNAIAVVTQLKMEFAGESLFDVEYNESYFV